VKLCDDMETDVRRRSYTKVKHAVCLVLKVLHWVLEFKEVIDIPLSDSSNICDANLCNNGIPSRHF